MAYKGGHVNDVPLYKSQTYFVFRLLGFGAIFRYSAFQDFL